MSTMQTIETGIRGSEATIRELQRREIARQVEQFLEHGGCIDVLRSPLREASPPMGRVWWEGETLTRP